MTYVFLIGISVTQYPGKTSTSSLCRKVKFTFRVITACYSRANQIYAFTTTTTTTTIMLFMPKNKDYKKGNEHSHLEIAKANRAKWLGRFSIMSIKTMRSYLHICSSLQVL